MASSRPRQTVIAVRYMDGEGEREEEGEGEREWALVEFQGEVLGAREAAAEEAMEKWGNGRGGTATIGEICCSASSKNKVNMRIGYHELEGKIEKLKKPLAILERRNANDDDDDEQLQAEEEEDNEGRTADVQHVNGSPHTSQRNTTRGTKRKDETWYDVVGFVKTKIAFVSRPTAIISKPVPKSAPGTGNGIKYRRFSHGGTTALNLTPNPPSPTKA